MLASLEFCCPVFCKQTTQCSYCTRSTAHLDLSSNEVQILVSGVGESAATVLADLHKTQSLQVVKAVTDDVSVSLCMNTSQAITYMIMVLTTDSVAMTTTESITKRLYAHIRSNVEVASNGGWTSAKNTCSYHNE